MTRFVIALAWIAACSGTAKTGSTSGTEPVIVKKVALSWGFEKQSQDGEPMADVFLAMTDETGKQVSHPLGRYKGVCTVITPSKEMNALTAVACRTGPTGTELHAVLERGTDVVILKLGIDEGVKHDPMAREEVTRVKVPAGAKVEVSG